MKAKSKAHVKRDHEGITYKCEQCDFVSKFKGGVTAHTKVTHEKSQNLPTELHGENAVNKVLEEVLDEVIQLGNESFIQKFVLNLGEEEFVNIPDNNIDHSDEFEHLEEEDTIRIYVKFKETEVFSKSTSAHDPLEFSCRIGDSTSYNEENSFHGSEQIKISQDPTKIRTVTNTLEGKESLLRVEISEELIQYVLRTYSNPNGEHTRNPHNCTHCHNTFSNTDSLNYHIRTIHGSVLHADVNLENLQSSFEAQPGPSNRDCISSTTSLVPHTENKTFNHKRLKISSYDCSLCFESFNDLTQLTFHKTSHDLISTDGLEDYDKEETKISWSKCSTCTKVFDGALDGDTMLEHTSFHLKLSLFECPFCFKHFTTMMKMLRHKSSHAKVKKEICLSCLYEDISFL